MKRRTFLSSTGAALTAAALPLFTTFAADATDAFDVVVYGGVPCGIAAAVAAAREGASVLLIEPTKHVGGLNTSGLNTAESEHMLKWTFGGIALEFYQRLGRHYGMKGPAFYFESGMKTESCSPESARRDELQLAPLLFQRPGKARANSADAGAV